MRSSFRFWPSMAMGLSGLYFSTVVLGSTTPHASEAVSGPDLTLVEAIAKTRSASPDLALFSFQLKAGQARVEAAGLKPSPEFQAQLENVAGTGRRRGLIGAETTFALSQVIELGGQRQRRIDVAELRRSGVEVERQVAQLDVLAEVGRRFLHVAADQKQLELTELATGLARKTLREVQRRVDTARSPVAELHRARITLARAEVEHEHAEHELLTSRRKLAAMWGEREPQFGPVAAELFRLPQVGDYTSLVAKLASSPYFLRFASEASQREAEIRLAEARARSNITVSAGIRRLEDTDDTALVAGFSLPLFGARRAAPAITEARVLRESVDAENTAARIKAEASLFGLVQELRHAITEAEMLRDQVLPQMEAALTATEYAWQRGRYSYLEWTEAQRERIAVQRALIEAAANAHQFQIEIERLTGTALDSKLSGAAGTEMDDHHAQHKEPGPESVRGHGTDAVHAPQPGQHDADVNPAVGSIDTPGRLRVQRQQPSESSEAHGSGQQQLRAAALLEPEIRQIAADDLREGRRDE